MPGREREREGETERGPEERERQRKERDIKRKREEAKKRTGSRSFEKPLSVVSYFNCLFSLPRTLSNTAPVYLSSMQHIVLSVDEVDGRSDVESFVNVHSDLHKSPGMPELELHPCSVWRSSECVEPSD